MELAGFILAIAVLIFFSMKGVGAVPASIVATLVLAIFSGASVPEALLVNYTTGVANFLKTGLILFIGGSLFGKVMSESGAAASIANKLLSFFGKKMVLIVLLAVNIFMIYVGIHTFVVIYTIYPIAIRLCKEAGIPRRLVIALTTVAATIQTYLPGTTGTLNTIMTDKMGVAPTAGAVWGILCGAITFALVILYATREHKKALANGEGFINTNSKIAETTISDEDLPGFVKSFLPIIVLMAIIFICGQFIPASVAVIIALLTATLISMILNWNNLPKNKIQLINQGLMSGIEPIITIGAISGFSAMLQGLPIFEQFANMLMNLNINPLVLLVITMGALSIVTTGALASGVFFMNSGLMDKFLTLGIRPDIFARFVTIGGVTTQILPYSGGLIGKFAITGATHKECYRDVFITCMLIPIIAAALTTGAALLFGVA